MAPWHSLAVSGICHRCHHSCERSHWCLSDLNMLVQYLWYAWRMRLCVIIIEGLSICTNNMRPNAIILDGFCAADMIFALMLSPAFVSVPRYSSSSSWTTCSLVFLSKEISVSTYNACCNFSFFAFSSEAKFRRYSPVFLKSCILLDILTLSNSNIFSFSLTYFCILAILSFSLLKLNIISSSLFIKSALCYSIVSFIFLIYTTCWYNYSLALIGYYYFSKNTSVASQVLYNLLNILAEFLFLDTSYWWFQFIVIAGSFSCQYWCNGFFSGRRHELYYSISVWNM